jgi:hypothetical protein
MNDTIRWYLGLPFLYVGVKMGDFISNMIPRDPRVVSKTRQFLAISLLLIPYGICSFGGWIVGDQLNFPGRIKFLDDLFEG